LLISSLAGAPVARAHFQAEGDIVGHGHMLEQRILLKHETGIAGARRHVQPVQVGKAHGAAVGHFQPTQDAQQRGLART
jgi:hypothetical protein